MNRIKKTPSYCMIKERSEKYGTNTLLPEEVVSALTGAPVEVIREAVEMYGFLEYGNYLDTLDLTSKQKYSIELLTEFHKLASLAKHKELFKVTNSDVAGAYCVDLYKNNSTRESFLMLCLNSTNQLIKCICLQTGTVSEVHVFPRTIVENALRYSASSVIICHNHPGNSSKPSSCDREVTVKVKDALKTVQVTLTDHLIVVQDSFYSMAEHGEL